MLLAADIVGEIVEALSFAFGMFWETPLGADPRLLPLRRVQAVVSKGEMRDEPEFAGTWSNYRFPGSGITVVSVIENELSGLFVLRPQLAGEKKRGGPR